MQGWRPWSRTRNRGNRIARGETIGYMFTSHQKEPLERDQERMDSEEEAREEEDRSNVSRKAVTYGLSLGNA